MPDRNRTTTWETYGDCTRAGTATESSATTTPTSPYFSSYHRNALGNDNYGTAILGYQAYYFFYFYRDDARVKLLNLLFYNPRKLVSFLYEA